MDCAHYLEQLMNYEKRNYLVQQLKHRPELAQYHLVATGSSGIMFATIISMTLGNEICIVRKDRDGSHSINKVENPPYKKWIFVDDLIDTGKSFLRCYRMLDQKKWAGVLLYEPFWNSGLTFYTPKQIVKLQWNYKTIKELAKLL